VPGESLKKLLRRVFHEIVAFDVELAAEGDAARAGGGIVRMVDGFELFALTFRIILDHDFQRPQHRHAPQRRPVELLANAEFQHADNRPRCWPWPPRCA